MKPKSSFYVYPDFKSLPNLTLHFFFFFFASSKSLLLSYGSKSFLKYEYIDWYHYSLTSTKRVLWSHWLTQQKITQSYWICFIDYFFFFFFLHLASSSYFTGRQKQSEKAQRLKATKELLSKIFSKSIKLNAKIFKNKKKTYKT